MSIFFYSIIHVDNINGFILCWYLLCLLLIIEDDKSHGINSISMLKAINYDKDLFDLLLKYILITCFDPAKLLRGKNCRLWFKILSRPHWITTKWLRVYEFHIWKSTKKLVLYISSLCRWHSRNSKSLLYTYMHLYDSQEMQQIM